MPPVAHSTSNLWTSFASIFSILISSLGQRIYTVWFFINNYLVQTMQKHISPALGAIFGMLFLEGHTMCKAAWYTLKKYRKDPKVYGFNQWGVTRESHRPVLLLYGAVGSWAYLGDLAVALKNANIPVFLVDIGFGLPSEETRKNIFNKIEEIRRLYHDETSTTTNPTLSDTIPLVDIVAHSNGGNLGLYSAFTQDCSYIDENGYLKFRSTPQANPHIGKVITIALPSNEEEVNWMHTIEKVNDLFNINAKFDALMGYKKCALVKQLPAHVEEINAGHIGIVFKHETYQRVIQFLHK